MKEKDKEKLELIKAINRAKSESELNTLAHNCRIVGSKHLLEHLKYREKQIETTKNLPV
jgi:hypothetical protein